MAPFVEGQRGTDNIAPFRVHYDLHREILELEPQSQPLTVFLNLAYKGGNRKPTKTYKYRWPEYELDDRLDAVDNVSGYSDSDTQIKVATIDLFYPEALVRNVRTGEVMRVEKNGVDKNTDTITVTRGVGPNGSAAILDGDPLLILGDAREEGDISPQARQRDPVELVNYCQTMKTTVEITGREYSSDEDTNPHDWRFQQKVRMIEHQKSKELTFWYGQPSESDIQGDVHPVTTTGGIEYFSQENNVDADGALTEVEFENFLRPALRHGDRTGKILFVSRLGASVINNFAHTKQQLEPGEKTYGVQIMRWYSAHGEVKVVVHDLFDESGYADRMAVLDFSGGKLKYRYLHGQGNAPGPSRDTHIRENVQENDRDGRKDEIISDCGLQASLAKTRAILTGVTG